MNPSTSFTERTSELFMLATQAPSGYEISAVVYDVLKLLLEKNISYGNSALDPIRVFSKASTEEQLFVRIDDKLNRLKQGSEYVGDDTVLDLVGYLILLLTLREFHDKEEG